MSDGNGPSTRSPRARACRTAGSMTSISSRPKLPPSPAWGLRPATAMRGRVEPGGAHAPIRERQRLARSHRPEMAADTCDSGMCEVTRAFQRLAQHIELACVGRRVEHIAHEADLVVVPVIGEAHRLLVERREEDGVGAARIGHTAVHGGNSRSRNRPPSSVAVAGSNLLGVEVLEIDEDRTARRRDAISSADTTSTSSIDTGDAGSLLQRSDDRQRSPDWASARNSSKQQAWPRAPG